MPSIAGDNDGWAWLSLPGEHNKSRQGRAAGAVPASSLLGKKYLSRIRGIEEHLSQAGAPIRLLGKLGACRGEFPAEHV
ncbi:MAG: hypothetical protein BGP08_21345 [Rhizobiales bacterium 64-17]|nr:MAG: hypothetical protein BGP08_21345 [Rhizobiales bacterium 64-17]